MLVSCFLEPKFAGSAAGAPCRLQSKQLVLMAETDTELQRKIDPKLAKDAVPDEVCWVHGRSAEEAEMVGIVGPVLAADVPAAGGANMGRYCGDFSGSRETGFNRTREAEGCLIIDPHFGLHIPAIIQANSEEQKEGESEGKQEQQEGRSDGKPGGEEVGEVSVDKPNEGKAVCFPIIRLDPVFALRLLIYRLE